MNKTAELVEPVRQSHVGEQMDRMSNNFNILEDNLTMLVERLDKVIFNRPATPEDCCEKEASSLCHHAEQLRGFNSRLENLKRRIMEVTQDVEI